MQHVCRHMIHIKKEMLREKDALQDMGNIFQYVL
jgi:hypothetical protein